MSIVNFAKIESDCQSTNLSDGLEERLLEESLTKIVKNNVRPKARTEQMVLFALLRSLEKTLSKSS